MTRRGLPGLVRPDHERPSRRHRPGARASSTGSSSASSPTPASTPLLPADERVAVIRDAARRRPAPGGRAHRRSSTFDGLTVTSAGASGPAFIVRGLRAISDFETEMQLAHNNRELAPGRRHGLLHDRRSSTATCSSSLVKEIAPFGGDVSEMIPRGRGRGALAAPATAAADRRSATRGRRRRAIIPRRPGDVPSRHRRSTRHGGPVRSTSSSSSSASSR